MLAPSDVPRELGGRQPIAVSALRLLAGVGLGGGLGGFLRRHRLNGSPDRRPPICAGRAGSVIFPKRCGPLRRGGRSLFVVERSAWEDAPSWMPSRTTRCSGSCPFLVSSPSPSPPTSPTTS